MRSLVTVVAAFAALVTAFASHAAAGEDAPAIVTARTPATFVAQKTVLSVEANDHYSSSPMSVDGMLAYPPSKSASSNPIKVVYLHGKNGLAEKGCPFMRDGASEIGWLACPEAIEKNEAGTWSWGADVRAQGTVVSHAFKSLEKQGASSDLGVAVGFSQGSYVALDLVKTNLGQFRGLVLIAAPEAHPSAAKLREAGVQRIALAAGQQDSAYAPLVEDVKRLQKEGMDARFYDLGSSGHTYAAENTAALHDAIVWAAGK